MKLVNDVQALLNGDPQLAQVLNLSTLESFPQLAGALFNQLCNSEAIGNVVHSVYASDRQLVEAILHDIARNRAAQF